MYYKWQQNLFFQIKKARNTNILYFKKHLISILFCLLKWGKKPHFKIPAVCQGKHFEDTQRACRGAPGCLCTLSDGPPSALSEGPALGPRMPGLRMLHVPPRKARGLTSASSSIKQG